MSVRKSNMRKKNDKSYKIMCWLLYMLVYTTIVSIIGGTVSENFGNMIIFGNIYMGWDIFFMSLMGVGWTLITFLIFKGKNMGEL